MPKAIPKATAAMRIPGKLKMMTDIGNKISSG